MSRKGLDYNTVLVFITLKPSIDIFPVYPIDNDNTNSHNIKRDQTIFPSSLCLVTLLWMEEKNKMVIKIYLPIF